MVGDYRKLSNHNPLRHESATTARIKLFKGKGIWLTSLVIAVGSAMSIQGQTTQLRPPEHLTMRRLPFQPLIRLLRWPLPSTLPVLLHVQAGISLARQVYRQRPPAVPRPQ